MGLFSRVRRTNGAAAASLSPPEDEVVATTDALPPAPEPPAAADDVEEPASTTVASAPRGGGGSGLSALREGLQQLYAIRPSRDAFAEEAIKQIVRGASVKAAALLSYDARAGRLHLLSHVGLETDAVHVLSGDAMVSAWDIPLRSLRNRRINVIAAAHENPFVPRALAAINPRRLTIAAIPFFHANAPIGALVLFSPTARGFADGLLKTISQALRVCAAALSELPLSAAAQARVVEEETPSAQPNLLRGLAALKGELARLTEALEEAERQRVYEATERVTAQSFLKAAQERAAGLEHELSELRAAQARVPEIEEQVRGLSRRLASASEAADAAQTQVAALQRTVGEHDARAAAQSEAIGELTAQRKGLEEQLQSALDTARARGEEAATLHAQVADLAPRAAQAGDLQTALAAAEAAKTETDAVIARLRSELLAAHDQRTRAEAALEQASAALAANDAERQALASQLEVGRAELAEQARARDELAALHARHADLQQALSARDAELEAARTSFTSDGRERAAALEQANARLVALDAERERLAAEVQQIGARAAAHESALSERGAAVAELERQLSATRDDAARIEAARAGLAQRADALAAELTTAESTRQRLEGELAAQDTARTQLLQERQALQTRVDALAAGGQTLEQERHAAIAGAQRRSAELEAEIARVSAALEATRTHASDELTRTRHDAESLLDGLRVDLAEAARARDELQRALATAQQECASHQRALAEMAAERAQLAAATERLSAERNDLGGRLDTSSSERRSLTEARDAALVRVEALERELRTVRDEQLAEARTALAGEQQTRIAVEAEVAATATRHAEEVAELRDQLAVFTHEQERLSQQLAEKDELLQSAEQDLGTLELSADGEDGEDDLVLDIERDAAPERAGAEEVDALADGEAAAPDAGELILLDGDASGARAARHLAEFGHRVSAMAPTPDGVNSFVQRKVTAAAVNLSTAVAWPTVRHLRNGSGIARMPLIAYALAENAPKGFWLGPVDFAILPVAQLDLPPLLNRLVPRVKRVLAMSNDIDVMSDVRTQLTAVNVSTAVVLDGRQALDLVPTIRPEAAILHLSPSCVDVFRAIAGLRTADAARDIPILFLLDAEPQPREEAFLTAGVRMLTGRGALAPDALVDKLASAFDSCAG